MKIKSRNIQYLIDFMLTDFEPLHIWTVITFNYQVFTFAKYCFIDFT